MKMLIITLGLLLSTRALADYQLVCRQKISSSQQNVDIFTLRGATQSFQQARKVIHVNQVSAIPTSAYDSVSNGDSSDKPSFERAEYSILMVKSSHNSDSFFINLHGGGSLSFKFNFNSKLWDGHFIRPYGPEMPEVFSGCTLDNPEIGFTARN
jgi:hypothetical protein